jgi:putative ABC transport system permease protein
VDPSPRAIVSIDGVTQAADGFLASGSFFSTLGVSAVIGRTFTDADDRRDGGADGPVAVISFGFWQRQFGGASNVIGHTIRLEDVPFTIVGVTPPAFFGLDVGRTFDVIMPLNTEPLVSRNESQIANGNSSWLNIIARLRPDQTSAGATTALRAIGPQILEATLPQDWPTAALNQYRARVFTVLPAATGDSSARGQYLSPLLAILGIVGLVLAIACANIANLLLARGTARRHELSVRVALGASRWRLVRQLFIESLLLSAAGAAIGVFVASPVDRFVVGEISTDVRPVFLTLTLDSHVLLLTLLVSVGAALLFGIGPALQASDVAPMDALKDGRDRQISGDGSRRIADGLVVVQVALSVILVVASGLFVRTFVALATRPLGFDRERVLIATINSHSAAIEPAARLTLYERARDAVAALPGVSSAAVSTQTPPVTGPTVIMPIDTITGGTRLQGMDRMTGLNFVTPRWFSTFGTRLVSGRDLSDRDRAGSPRVALANRAFARKFLNDANPVGHVISTIGGEPRRTMSIEVIGFVEDAIHGSLRHPVKPMLYLPLTQADWLPTGWLAEVDLSVRSTSLPPSQLTSSITRAIQDVSPDLVITSHSLADQINDTLTQERIVALLSGVFSTLALILAGLGLYGVAAYAVIRRRIELGIRMALGSAPSAIMRLALARIARLVGVGLLIGIVASLVLSRFVVTLLYGVEPRDPITLLGAVAILAVVAAVAGWLPAWRASRIDPALVLREQ